MPGHHDFTKRAVVRLNLFLYLVLMGGGATPMGAQSDTLDLALALQVARAANPTILAARLSADAARERVQPAGTLPDPRLSFALMNRPLSDFGSGERMTMNRVELSQVLPWPGKLGFAREQAAALADAEAFSADEARLQLLGQVKALYYQLAYLDRAVTIARQTQELLRDFHRVSETRYAVGEGLQQDVLTAQVSIARTTEDITVMLQERRSISARFNALLGRDATDSIPALALPAVAGSLPEVGALQSTARANRPALRAAAERTRAAEAGYRAARRDLYPDLLLSLGYGQRPQFDDMVTLMVGVSLPLHAGSRQLPARREMEAMRARQAASERDLEQETFAQLVHLRAQAERARELARLYDTAVIPQAQASVESALSAYRVGKVDYMTLVQSEMTVNRYQIERVRLRAEYHQAVAHISALTGEEDPNP